VTHASSPKARPGRRTFLAATALAGGGLALGFALRKPGRGTPASARGPDGSFSPSPLIRLHADGRVVLVAKQMEVGQGVKTTLPMLIAEELEIDWSQVTVEQGDLDAAYGDQFSGASRSTRVHYRALRVIGATARQMLVTAAAQAFGVDARECVASRGAVHHRASGRSLGYGALAERAAGLPVPHADDITPKPARDFKLIGTRVGGVDVPKIVAGEPLYASDLRLPGMLHAVYLRRPAPAGLDLASVRRLPGVREVFVIEGRGGARGLRPGIAVVADGTWAALQARRALEAVVPEPIDEREDSSRHAEEARRLAAGPAQTRLRDDGDVARALSQAAQRVDAWYAYPFIAHAAMEPPSACAQAHADGTLELWSASQSPGWARDNVAATLGLAKERIRLHVMRGGGAFGRGLSSDWLCEAAAIALRVQAPVQLLWTREDDLRHDHPRASGFHQLRGGLDAEGHVLAWHDHYLSVGRNGKPDTGLEADEFPARWVPHCRVEHSVIDSRTTTGAWRAPGANVHTWVIQSFVDELAHAAGHDPLAFRLRLLGDREEMRPAGLFSRGDGYPVGRLRRVLQAAADKARWGRPLPRGQGQGIAFHASHGGCAAHVAEVTVSPDGGLHVDRMVCVVDVGEQIVNPSGAEAQVQGSVHDGLASLFQELTLVRGRVTQGNFHEYPLLRMKDAPTAIEVHFLTSPHPVSGLGEPALPSVAPAVCNAIFRATGHRVRALPIRPGHLGWGGSKG
jgi:isoquinoline 1-oxidoreductase subunit beta